MVERLADRVALVTGASSATGAATAHLLAAEGARVALVAPPAASDRFNTLAAQLRVIGGEVLPLLAALGTRTQARALVRRVVETWGRVDILVVADGYDAAAGAPTDGAIAPPAPRRLGRPELAVRGLLHVSTAALPQMQRQGGGDIVVIAPVAGHVLRAGAGGLASARIALEVVALCDTLRRQGSPHGVRVAVVEPDGLVPGSSTGSSSSLTAEDVADAILYVLTRPPHVSIAEVLVRPTNRRV